MAIEALVLDGAEALLHAGDVGNIAILDMMLESGLPTTAVFGNNDFMLFEYQKSHPIHSEPHYFELGGLKFKMMHMPYHMSADCDVAIFGHLHKFESSKPGRTLFINPGEVCAREKGVSECAILETKEDMFLVNYMFRSVQSDFWHKREYEYKR